MNKAELVQLTGWRLGDRDDLAARIDAELPMLQETALEGHIWLPWFIETEISDAACKVGERRVALPLDFLAEIEDSHLYVLPMGVTVPIELTKKDPDVALAVFPNPLQGFPKLYAISGLYFHMYPLPDDAYRLAMRYYGKASPIVDDAVVSPWLTYAADIVLAELCKVLAEKHIKDMTAAAGFAKDAQAAWERLYVKQVERNETNVERSLGGNS